MPMQIGGETEIEEKKYRWQTGRGSGCEIEDGKMDPFCPASRRTQSANFCGSIRDAAQCNQI